jgi:hypothetical protein
VRILRSKKVVPTCLATKKFTEPAIPFKLVYNFQANKDINTAMYLNEAAQTKTEAQLIAT